ncbi:MAG: hypothetical protein ACQEQL_03190 [Pseudomonadota bacterium]
MKFIKENLLLSMGILLPVLLMAIFSLSMLATQDRQAELKYDFLFTLGKYTHDGQSHVNYDIINNRLKAEVKTPDDDSTRTIQHRLYRYHAGSGKVEDITPDIIETEEGELTVSLDEGLKDLELDTSPTSPDDHVFAPRRHRSHGLVGGLFTGRNYDRNYVIRHESHNYDIELPAEQRWTYPVSFLGWVIAE